MQFPPHKDDEMMFMERHGTGYRFRKGTRREMATSNIVSILIVIAGIISCAYWYNMFL